MKSCYLFGYGSLICSHSRSLTCPELADRWSIPMMIKGLERLWCKRTNVGMTAMGVRFRPKAKCAGILLPLASEQELERFDEREQGYRRVAIDPRTIAKIPFLTTAPPTRTTKTSLTAMESKNDQDLLSHYYNDYHHEQFLEELELAQHDLSSTTRKTTNKSRRPLAGSNMQVWVYVPEEENLPSPQFPIVQSYVDTILRGCLDVGGEAMCAEFLTSTAGWHSMESPLPLNVDQDEEEDDWDDMSSSSSVLENDVLYDTNNEMQRQQPDSMMQQAHGRSKARLLSPPPILPQTNKRNNASVHWINDRSNPVYRRGDYYHSLQNAYVFDRLIRQYRPECLLARRNANQDASIRRPQ